MPTNTCIDEATEVITYSFYHRFPSVYPVLYDDSIGFQWRIPCDQNPSVSTLVICQGQQGGGGLFLWGGLQGPSTNPLTKLTTPAGTGLHSERVLCPVRETWHSVTKQ